MFRLLLFVVCVSSTLASLGDALADDADEDHVASALRANNAIAWSQMTVKVLDPDGKPIEGAVVRPWALIAEGRGAGFWNDVVYGSARRTTTSAMGEAEVVFPQSAHQGIKMIA